MSIHGAPSQGIVASTKICARINKAKSGRGKCSSEGQKRRLNNLALSLKRCDLHVDWREAGKGLLIVAGTTVQKQRTLMDRWRPQRDIRRTNEGEGGRPPTQST